VIAGVRTHVGDEAVGNDLEPIGYPDAGGVEHHRIESETLWADGAELDFGTAMNATPEASANACFTAAANITEQAQHWRDVLAKAMAVGGMVNYPPEWWHWSYGDR